MNKYKCPECGAIHTEEDWDEATRQMCSEDDDNDYDEILPLSNGEFGVFYFCPTCDRCVEFRDIEKIEEVKEKCEYCEVDADDKMSLLVVETDFYNYEIYIDGNNNLTHNDMFEDNKINYCPMCGRKL